MKAAGQRGTLGQVPGEWLSTRMLGEEALAPLSSSAMALCENKVIGGFLDVF